MNIKRFLAVALATTMVLGSTMTAFAANSDTDASGTLTGTGAGAQEGFVDTNVTKVLIPTTESVDAALGFKIDPQRLIQETDKAAYADYTFPEAASDTGVYFLTGSKEYSNTSSTFYVANKGTGDVTFTITSQLVPSTDATKDIAIGTKAEATSDTPTAAKLYVGVLIGKNPTAIQVTTTAAAKKVVLAADANNFEYTYSNGAYGYAAKSSAKWNAVPIQFEGAVANYATSADTTVPKLQLTYAWAAKENSDATDSGITVDTAYSEDAAPSIATTSYTQSAAGQDVAVTVDFGAGPSAATAISAITFVKNGITKTLDTAYYAVSGNTLTFKADHVDALTEAREYTIKFNDTANTSVKVTVTPAG